LVPWELFIIGLPRIRGDRPLRLAVIVRIAAATPHTRGSTPIRAQMKQGGIGYPAYAGIAPLAIVFTLLLTRLPRIRGDRPMFGTSITVGFRATPHTRGSTTVGSRGGQENIGYPAYAGIDLFQSMHRNVVQQLPRKRGEFSFHSNWLSFQGILLL